MSLLEKINDPSDLRKLKVEELPQLAAEAREELVRVVSKTGGHLGANLGVVELTVALHYAYNTPEDKIVWDVTHQVYIHKMLTGRRDKLGTLRQYQGLSGFARRLESPYDTFGAGHGSTALSAAVGMMMAREHEGKNYKVAAIVGDAALTGGMALEALNHAGHLKKDLLVILNDNEWSISKNVGAMAGYLNRIITGDFYNRAKTAVENILKSLPATLGEPMLKVAHILKEDMKGVIAPGILFEELGFNYVGPVDGHNVTSLVELFQKIRNMKGPVLLHLITKKGKGYEPAEKNPGWSHGVTPFSVETGAPAKASTGTNYMNVFGDALIETAKKNPHVVAITAAMADGTGLAKFAKAFPDRFYDVGMAEQHAVTFAAGLATQGVRPVAAIYSTFLQRAYDQVIHDVCLQNLPVIFALDRAGLVGEDGPTHHGVFDLSYLRMIPNMTVMVPADYEEVRLMVEFAAAHDSGPISLRYPRGGGPKVVNPDRPTAPIVKGKAVVLREGKDVALLAVGNMVERSLMAAEMLKNEGIRAAVVNLRFVKPLDRELLLKLASSCPNFVSVEDNVLAGGMGSGILEFFEQEKVNVQVKRIGIADHFVDHGALGILHELEGLTPPQIANSTKAFLATISKA